MSVNVKDVVSVAKKDVMDLAFKKILKYLTLMKRNIIHADKDDYVIVVEETVEGYEKPIRILIKIFNENWLSIMAPLMEAKEFQDFLKGNCHPAIELLKLSFRAAEFNFAMDPSGNILMKEDIHLAALSFDVFDEEYFAIPAAFRAFREQILPKLRECKELADEELMPIYV